jgi:hypothetical protein
MTAPLLDYYLTYAFLKRLVLPFEQWPAFKAGVIDEEGDVLVPQDRRSQQQREAFGHYDVMVRNMKRLLGVVPGGKTMLASSAAALALMRETYRPSGLPEVTFWAAVSVLAEDVRFQHLLVEEDGAPTNGVGGIAGLDARHLPAEAQWGWPRKKKRKVEAFSVDPKMFRRIGAARTGRTMAYEEALDGALGWAIMEYAAVDPSRPIAIANAATGEVLHLRHGKGVVLTCEAEEDAAETIASLTERLERRLTLFHSLAESESSEDDDSARVITEIEGTGGSLQTHAQIAGLAIKGGVEAIKWARKRRQQKKQKEIERQRRDADLKARGFGRRTIRDVNVTGKAAGTSRGSGKDLSGAKRVRIKKPVAPPPPPEPVPAKKRTRKPVETGTMAPKLRQRKPATATVAAAEPPTKRRRKPVAPVPPTPMAPAKKPAFVGSQVPSPAAKKERERQRKKDDLRADAGLVGTAIKALGRHQVNIIKDSGRNAKAKVKSAAQKLKEKQQRVAARIKNAVGAVRKMRRTEPVSA